MTARPPWSTTGPTAQAVDSFVKARLSRPRWIGVPPEHRPKDLASGYAMQKAVEDALVAKGARKVGYKIGATSVAGQRSLGLTEPAYAGLFAQSRLERLDDVFTMDLMAPMAECEVAVVLAAPLDARKARISAESAADSIESCCLCCEIVDNRYGDPLAAGLPAILADGFFHVAFLLGPAQSGWRALDLSDLSGEIRVSGTAYHGHSSDVLDPLTALSWLAGKLAETGRRLEAGEIVLTGSVVAPTRFDVAARSLSLSLSGFGSLATATLPSR